VGEGGDNQVTFEDRNRQAFVLALAEGLSLPDTTITYVPARYRSNRQRASSEGVQRRVGWVPTAAGLAGVAFIAVIVVGCIVESIAAGRTSIAGEYSYRDIVLANGGIASMAGNIVVTAAVVAGAVILIATWTLDYRNNVNR